MSPQPPSSAPAASQDTPRGDPWHAFGYLVSGVLVYGVLGRLVDRWLGTTFVVGIGILVGAGLGIYMTFMRFNRAAPAPLSGPGVAGTQRPEQD